MKNVKKLLALVLSVIMTVSLFVPVSFADGFSDVGEDTNYYEAINYLASAGIINGFEDGTFKPGETVTRAQFAKIMAYALKCDNIVATKQIFTDVSVDHWAAGNIEAMVAHGIINGMGDGTFAPESPVTYEQAVKMTVCALGYDAIAQKQGGYPDGYLKVAANRGFVKGIVDGALGVGANRGLIAQLVDNMLGIDKIDPVTGELQEGSSSKDEDLGSETIKGQVVATYRAGLTTTLETLCKKNEIIINDGEEDILFTTDGLSDQAVKNISSYLGKRITGNYYEEDDETKVLTTLTSQKGRNDLFGISAEDIYDFSENEIRYYDEDSEDIEKLSLTDGYSIIFNGKATEKTLSEIVTPLMSGDGTIELLSSDGDGSYDVLFIKSYETFVAYGIPQVATGNDKMVVVTDKNNTANKYTIPKMKTADEPESSKVTAIYELNGSKATHTAIVADSIVSIAKSDDNTVFEILVSTEKLKDAKVTSLSIDEMLIGLDNKEYRITDSFKEYIENNSGMVSVGAKGEFALDAFQKVASIKVAASNYTYGYLTDAQTSSSSKNDPLVLKIYAVGSGSTMTAYTYSFKDTFYVNGEKYKLSDSSDVDDVLDMLQASADAFVTTVDDVDYITGTEDRSEKVVTENHKFSQPVEFSVSGITDKGNKAIEKLFIYTPEAVNDSSKINTNLVLSSKETEPLDASRTACSLAGAKRNFGGIYVDGSTKVIVVPKDKADGKFYSRSQSYLNQGATYNYHMFDTTAGNIAGLMVVYATEATSAAAITYANTPYIVTKADITKSITIDGIPTEVQAIELTNPMDGATVERYKGEETKVYAVKLSAGSYVKDTEKTISFEDLKAGDVVRYMYDAEGFISDIEVVALADEIESTTDFVRGVAPFSPTYNEPAEDAAYRTVIGTAYTLVSESNDLVVVPEFPTDGVLTDASSLTWDIDNTRFYVVDTAQDKEKDVVTLKDASSVYPYVGYPESPSTILGFAQYGSVKVIIIFK